jgi:hypothetical protein
MTFRISYSYGEGVLPFPFSSESSFFMLSKNATIKMRKTTILFADLQLMNMKMNLRQEKKADWG